MSSTSKHAKLDVPYHVALHSGPTAIGGRAAEKVLNFVKKHGLPDATGRKSSRRHRHDYISEATVYGPILKTLQVELDDGSTLNTVAVSPFALLVRTVRECAPFRQLMRETLEAHPCTIGAPWGIIIYFDEVTPTDPRNTKPDKRKLQCFYWTFREFGIALLSREECWFVATCTRSIVVHELEVGMCQLVKEVLSQLFFNRRAQHFALSGCTFELNEPADKPCVQKVFAVHCATVADFLAIKDVLHSFGHGGLKPCPCCRNIVKSSIAEGSDVLLPTHSLECHRFHLRTDDSLRALQAELAASKPRLSSAKFAEMESRSGFHYNPKSILNDSELQYNAISTLMFDWPHVYLIHGICQYDTDAFMAEARAATPNNLKAIVTYETLHEHVSEWTWPQRWQSCKDVFIKGKMDSTASEQLSLATVLRYFFQEIVLKVPEMSMLHDAAEAMASLYDVLEAFLCASRDAITPQELHEHIVANLRKSQHAFGTEYQKFKHHMPLHIASMWEKLKFLVNSMVTERKHRNPKRLAFARRTQCNYEQGVLEDLVLQHFQDWKEIVLDRRGIQDAHPITRKVLQMTVEEAFPHAQSILTGCGYVSPTGASFHVGDYALLASADLGRITLAQIWHFFDVDGIQRAAVATWPSRRIVRSGAFAMYAHYNTGDEFPLLVDSSTLACTVIVRRRPHAILAIVPRLYQLGIY